MPPRQPDLFAARPEGLTYAAEFLSAAEEQALATELAALPWKPFEFRGYVGKRRVVSFGWRYDFGETALKKAEDMPAFLLPIRARAAGFAGLAPAALEHVLLTEYTPGAEIGWHRDRSVFGKVIGISLLSPCVLRFRKKRGDKWERVSIPAEPRSIYALRGTARTEWEHSIPAVPGLRYSMTFRTLR